jgi:hypothetical protein
MGVRTLGGREADAGSGAKAPVKQVVSRREAAADAKASGLAIPLGIADRGHYGQPRSRRRASIAPRNTATSACHTASVGAPFCPDASAT